jgi:hypothetical protein
VDENLTTETFDLDGDGMDDATLVDGDADGYNETLVSFGADGSTTVVADTNGDGLIDVRVLDTDSDGVYEAVQQDLDGDGATDVTQLDLDGDGVFEVLNVAGSDLYLDPQTGVVVDVVADAGSFADIEPPGFADPAAGGTGTGVGSPGEDTGSRAPDPVATPSDGADDLEWPDDAQEVVPTPLGPDLAVGDNELGDGSSKEEIWFLQAANGFCAPASVAQVVAAYTGTEIADETAFVEYAVAEGWLTVDPVTGEASGMYPEDAHALLEAFGVESTLMSGSMDSLALYLEGGYEVIVTVDADEIWEGAEDDHLEGGVAPDHMLVVTGIDLASGMVTLSDPGHPDGNMSQVPLSVFVGAWDDSEFEMLVADAPTAGATPDLSAELADVGFGTVGAGMEEPSDAGGQPSLRDHLADPSVAGVVLVPVALAATALIRSAL